MQCNSMNCANGLAKQKTKRTKNKITTTWLKWLYQYDSVTNRNNNAQTNR